MQLHIDIPPDLHDWIMRQIEGKWLCGPPPTVEQYVVKLLMDGVARQVRP